MARLPPVNDNDRPGVSIERILADPLVRAVMRADHVKPKALAALLQSVASKRARFLANPRRAAEPEPVNDSGTEAASIEPTGRECRKRWAPPPHSRD